MIFANKIGQKPFCGRVARTLLELPAHCPPSRHRAEQQIFCIHQAWLARRCAHNLLSGRQSEFKVSITSKFLSLPLHRREHMHNSLRDWITHDRVQADLIDHI
jgi:hypothetical protein